MFYRLKQGIINLIKWFPIIWQDRDWDYHYIYKILHFKLKNMEEFMLGNKCWSANHKQIAHEIKIAKLLLERLMKDNYLENAMYWYDKKFEDRSWDEMFQDEGNGLKRYIGDPNIERDKSFGKCCKHSDYMEKQDLNYLFKHMRKYIKNWWD